MEETHQKVVEDLQRQHQREVSKLLEERERLLAEETAATISGEETVATWSDPPVNARSFPSVVGKDLAFTSHHIKLLKLVTDNRCFVSLAIEAMKNAHKEDLEKTQRPALSGLDSDIDQLHSQYE